LSHLTQKRIDWNEEAVVVVVAVAVVVAVVVLIINAKGDESLYYVYR